MTAPLEGLRILLLEDEFLIAMDVEQTCLDFGAREVTIAKSLDELSEIGPLMHFDAAIVDIMLAGRSTLDFARGLKESRTPFVFASGYSDLRELDGHFPGVTVVGKPYAGNDLVDALVGAIQQAPTLG